MHFFTYDEMVTQLVKEAHAAFGDNDEALSQFINDDPILYHSTLGRDIRNKFDLWDKKNPVCKTKGFHADDYSQTVIIALQERLKHEQMEALSEPVEGTL